MDLDRDYETRDRRDDRDDERDYRDERDHDDDRDHGRDRDRSRSRERERRDSHRDRDRDDDVERDDRRRERRRSRSRSRSPRRRSRSGSRSHDRERDHDRDRDRKRSRRESHSNRDDDLYRPTESRSRSRERDRDRPRERRRGERGGERNRDRPPRRWGSTSGPQPVLRSEGGPMNAPVGVAEAHTRVSRRENRLYVGNLKYEVTFKDLERFMGQAGGEVVFSEILVTPQGNSKGCGVVEFATRDQARVAIDEIGEKMFMGRPVFLRPDREPNARFGAAPIPGRIGMALGEAASFGGQPTNRNVFVNNIPFGASWQDLKDLMRQAGEVIRADVAMTPDGRPKGNGTVVFVDAQGAANAIRQLHGFDWNGSVIEVREDRFAAMPGRAPIRGGPPIRGGMRGMPRGGFGRGGFGGGFGGGAGFGGGGFGQGFSGGFQQGPPAQGFGGAVPPPAAPATNGSYPTQVQREVMEQPAVAEPSPQIWVGNLIRETAHLDLVELFATVAPVVLAEILLEGGESRGEGIVQFQSAADAAESITRFNGYAYGGVNLDVQYNPRWHEFGPDAARGDEARGAEE
ncbi:uncharacterized protein CcaverHIS019_0305400 [Cutaneotrichosporon cavernicola]|uniref:RRM domain-containing protein n=1 Tax=Cutaneotrichosporon cavernicola TaxID=279322 RepID=A0AA48L1Z3_9TREE|nr:uncharacterized protein CcaverHIS019_0305400 [Cutaneotrichosporon cavernicola]BEI90470.1 hypothetical protein CcaverHIS019_0305400 [Cutaneotrichosporon cavernicola]BEI98244.1 hypothetical protein CcaverHIS631_0305430 [Cutaneotrichosporon cavernicola]BEJ06020.1 hypothetical protein CcaverHIS641_0305420 [Cutaneotrichosporon cavernicola]